MTPEFMIHKHSFNSPYHQMGSPVWVPLPRGAEVLSFALQQDVPVFWYRFDRNVLNDPDKRLFLLCITGQDYDLNYDAGLLEVKQFIGTAMNAAEDFVLHLFELGQVTL